MPYWFDSSLFCARSFYFVAAGDLCSCWWSVSETDHDLCSFCAPLQKPKLMLFLFWCTLRLVRLFSCSHLTLRRLLSSYGTAALLSVLLPVVMPHIIGLSSSCMLSLFSPMVTSALMFFSVELQLAPSLPISLQTVPMLLSCDWLDCLLLVSGLSEWLA